MIIIKKMEHFNLNPKHNRFVILLYSHTFRNFFTSLFAVFLPIFLLTQGYSLLEVILFELGNYFLGLLLVYPLLKFISTVHLKYSFIISYLFTVIYYGSLYFFDTVQLYLSPIMILVLLIIIKKGTSTIYWYSYHILFSVSNGKTEIGKSLGEIMSYPKFLRLLSPLVGAFLIAAFSYNLVFVIILSFLTISLIPLFLIKYPSTKDGKFTFQDIFNKKFVKTNKFFFIEGIIENMEAILWPIYLYIIQFKLVIVGLFVTLISFAKAVAIYILGRFVGKKRYDKWMVKIGLILVAIGSIFRVITLNKYLIFIAQTIGAFGVPLYRMPIMTNMYKRSKKNLLLSIAGREIFLNVGRISILLIAAIFIIAAKASNITYIFYFVPILLLIFLVFLRNFKFK